MFYERMQSLGVRMLAEYGHQLTRTRITSERPIGGNAWDPPISVTDTYVFNGFARGVDAKLVNGTSILASDLLLICDHTAQVDIGDVIALPDGDRQVDSRQPVPASGDLTIQKFILR